MVYSFFLFKYILLIDGFRGIGLAFLLHFIPISALLLMSFALYRIGQKRQIGIKSAVGSIELPKVQIEASVDNKHTILTMVSEQTVIREKTIPSVDELTIQEILTEWKEELNDYNNATKNLLDLEAVKNDEIVQSAKQAVLNVGGIKLKEGREARPTAKARSHWLNKWIVFGSANLAISMCMSSFISGISRTSQDYKQTAVFANQAEFVLKSYVRSHALPDKQTTKEILARLPAYNQNIKIKSIQNFSNSVKVNFVVDNAEDITLTVDRKTEKMPV